MDLSKSIKTCSKNGYSLIDDAEHLLDFERNSSAYALAILAQEEFGKCFILKLVDSGALNWSKEVRRSLEHHVSKQLMVIVLDFLNPNDEDYEKGIKDKTFFNRPKKVSDALDIYVFEILKRWEPGIWWWEKEPKYNKDARSIFKEKTEKLKQSALYVSISKIGTAIDSSASFKNENVKLEIDKAKRCGSFIDGDYVDSKYKEIVETLKLVKT